MFVSFTTTHSEYCIIGFLLIFTKKIKANLCVYFPAKENKSGELSGKVPQGRPLTGMKVPIQQQHHWPFQTMQQAPKQPGNVATIVSDPCQVAGKAPGCHDAYSFPLSLTFYFPLLLDVLTTRFYYNDLGRQRS